MRPVDVWCGPNHTLVLLQDESGAKELHGCGFGAAGRLPGHPKGSDVLVKLNVLVGTCVSYTFSTVFLFTDCL
jgi:F-box protein 24